MGRKASEHKVGVELEFTAQSTPLDPGLPPGGLWSYSCRTSLLSSITCMTSLALLFCEFLSGRNGYVLGIFVITTVLFRALRTDLVWKSLSPLTPRL